MNNEHQKTIIRMEKPSSLRNQLEALDLDGFDGPRMFRLRECINDCVNGILTDTILDWGQFVGKLEPKSFVDKSQTSIFPYYLEFKEKFKTNLETEIHDLLTSANIRRKLNAIDLHVQLDGGEILYPKSVGSDLHSKAWKNQSLHAKIEVKQAMQRLLNSLSQDNERLIEQNEKQARQLKDYVQQLNQKANQLQSTIQILQNEWEKERANQTLKQFRPN
jgi:hypothetical protein